MYEKLSEGVAGDDGLLDLLMRTPSDQRRPSLLFAAVNHLLAAHPRAALADYYPVHGGRRPVDDQLVQVFGAFCAEHAGELGRLLRTGSTQTNEIRRCVALRLGLGHVSRRWPGPVALAEVGASAGLNLLFDRYRYRLGGWENGGQRAAGRGTAPAGPSPVLISCQLRGGAGADQVPGATPEITARLGIDQRPVLLGDPAERAWLAAFIWPEDVAGLATLRAAMDFALASGPAPVVPGDAVTDTARLLAGLPGDEPVAVFTATLLSYLGADERTAFLAQLDEVARRRPLAWIFAEAPGLVAPAGLGLPALQGPLGRRNSFSAVGVSLRAPGQRDDALLALADPYLRWLAPARHQSDDFEWLQAT